MNGTRPTASPRIAWFETPGAQSERDRPAPDRRLAPPDDVRAVRGRGQVTLTWRPVAGAIGYLVLRTDDPGATPVAVDPGVGDVLAVPSDPFVDTTGDVNRAAGYAVASIAGIDGPAGDPSPVVAPEALPDVDLGRVAIHVDAASDRGPLARPWRRMMGSEHLALLLDGPGPGGLVAGDDLAEAFEIVRRDLGVELVRAHGILHDRLAVYREENGRARHDFRRVDAALDRLLATGLRPVVELSFVPHDLASDPERTIFDYRGIVSPPRDLDRWRELVEALVRHLALRYGREEVGRWAFEVWNEPNLQMFWTGSQADYFDLYDASAAAVKAVDPAFRVGGPATSAAAWVDDLLEHCRSTGVPIDFVSTHTYGVPPLDLRPVLERHGRRDLPIWWTEWGVTAGLGGRINDGPWGAPLVARGMRSAAGRVDALSSWVASDQFVEGGEPDRLLHGGFGLLTVGNLRKPRYWALWILEQLGEREVACGLDGDGAGSLVEAWASRSNGRVAIAAWNGTRDLARADGDERLGRRVELRIDGLAPGPQRLRHRRVDLDHSNVDALWRSFGDDPWPDDFGWERLRERDFLEDLEPPATIEVAADGSATFEFDLPMPAISLVELEPASQPGTTSEG